MKNITRFLLPVLLTLGLVSPAFAQTQTTNTTLSSAITGNVTSFALASVTGIAAGSEICFIDAIECDLVSSVSGTTVTVNQRGVDGTRVASHQAGAIVFASAAGAPSASTNSPFIHGDPTAAPGGNNCVRVQQPLLPLFNVDSGTVWDCTLDATAANSANANAPSTPTIGRWRGTNLVAFDQSVMPRQVVINTDYQIKAWDFLVAVTSLTKLGGINLTLPSVTGLIGKSIIIKDEGGFVGGTNLVLTVIGTIDGATNIAISSAYSNMRLYSNGVNWLRW